MLIRKLLTLFKQNGLIYFLQVLIKIFYSILNWITTFYYKRVLGALGDKSVVEFGVWIDKPRNVFISYNVVIQKGTKIGSENDTGKLFIGNNVNIARSVSIDHTAEVIIDENVNISAHSSIFSHSHGYDAKSPAQPLSKHIGKNVWIGYSCIILESCRIIKPNTIVGAGVVLTKDTFDSEIVVGSANRNIERGSK